MRNNQMFRRFISLLLLIVLLLGLCACHGTNGLPEFEIPQSFDESKSYEITFWAKNDTNKTQADLYEKAIVDFEKLYPNIKVNLRLYTDYRKLYNDVITNIATNTTPNICVTYPDHIATYLTGINCVVPLDDLFADTQYGFGGSALKYDGPEQDEVVEEFLNECKINGISYAIPYMRSTEACYVNKTYVEKLGFELPEVMTWDFIWQVSEAAMEKDENDVFKVNGQKVMIPFIYKSTDNMMIQMLKQRGAPYSDEDGNIDLFNDVTEEILYEVAEHAKTRAFSTFKISSYPGNFLNQGQCIFAIDSTAGATWMGTDAPLLDISKDKLVEFETVVCPIPQYDTDNPKMISQGPSICLFNKQDPQEVLASWLFMQYLLTNDVQIPYSQTEGYLPVTHKALNSETYTDYLSRSGEDNNLYYYVKIDAAKLLRDNISNTFVTPVFNGSASLRDAAGQVIENVAKSVRRKETVDEAYMQKLFQDVNSLYRLDQHIVNEGTKKELGALPTASKVLLSTIAVVWILIGIYVIRDYYKKKRPNAS